MRHPAAPFLAALLLAGGSSLAVAETPQGLLAGYSNDAARGTPGFTPSAARGEAFYRKPFGIAEKMPACSSCHTDTPTAAGRHAVTGKTIRPLAPSANGERFSDPAKVEKWFGRNCREVAGRDCTAAEKADFMKFVMEAR